VEEESGPHNNAQSYTLITINEAGDFGLIQANYDAAALVANYYFENCLGNDADESCKAASQIAVWELIFDGPGAFNLTGGSFTSSNIFNSEANTIWGLAQVTPTGQHYVLAVNPTVDYGDDVVVAEFQNYLVPVPEPSTIVLIGLGLCGLGVFARRKK
jgi:hypothetical protein